jgi:hypothetical protein
MLCSLLTLVGIGLLSNLVLFEVALSNQNRYRYEPLQDNFRDFLTRKSVGAYEHPKVSKFEKAIRRFNEVDDGYVMFGFCLFLVYLFVVDRLWLEVNFPTLTWDFYNNIFHSFECYSTDYSTKSTTKNLGNKTNGFNELAQLPMEDDSRRM